MSRTSVVAAALLSLLAVGCNKQAEAGGRQGTMLALNDPPRQKPILSRRSPTTGTSNGGGGAAAG